MPAERVAMRQAHEIIRLKFSAGLPTREIARRLGVAASTVRGTLRRFEGAGLSWPLPVGMSDGDLEAALYANHGTKRGHRRHAEPDWPTVHRELKRKHVTLVIVWDEYIAANPGGYSYSRFCELYRGFELKLSPTMRQTHAAGERLLVDYAGDGVPVVIDRLTGEIRKAQIFVAVLGASSFTFAHASWTQALPDWIDAHVRALEVIGGVPHLLVPDNTKTAVIKACLYDPQVVPCSRIQRRRARATSPRFCSAACRLFFKADIVSIKETLESAPTAGDALFSHDGEKSPRGSNPVVWQSEPRSSPSALPMAKHSRRSVSAPRFLSHSSVGTIELLN